MNAEVYAVNTSCVRLTFVPLSLLGSAAAASRNRNTGAPLTHLKCLVNSLPLPGDSSHVNALSRPWATFVTRVPDAIKVRVGLGVAKRLLMKVINQQKNPHVRV